MLLIRPACFDVLPLSAEPINEWAGDGDLFVFLTELNDSDGSLIDVSGREVSINYRSEGEHLYTQGRSSFQALASEFHAIAVAHEDTPIPHGPIRIDKPIDFLGDASFGFMAKHAIAWNATVDALLSDDGFFSLPHILESRTELDCSILLAKQLYYKQALQVLRGLLELNVLHVHFAGDEAAYREWQSGTFRTQMRGKGGLLRSLKEKGVISAEISDSAATLYGALNESIHNAEARMVNTGLRDGYWAGLQFKSDEYRTWTDYVGQIVTLGIRLLGVGLQGKHRRQNPDAITCSTCRAGNEFAVEDRSDHSTTLRCLRCGWQSSFTREYANRHGFS